MDFAGHAGDLHLVNAALIRLKMSDATVGRASIGVPVWVPELGGVLCMLLLGSDLLARIWAEWGSLILRFRYRTRHNRVTSIS